jgi:hypothetical protein
LIQKEIEMSVLTLELPDTLYQQLEAQARSEGTPLAQFVLTKLIPQESFHYHVEAIPAEVQEQEREAFARLMGSAPPATDEEMKRFLAEREPVEPEPDLSPEVVARLRQRWQSKDASSSAARQGD